MFSLHLPCDARRLVTYNSTVSDPRMPNEINILWPTLLPNTAKFKILYLHHYKDRIFLGLMTTLNTKMTTVKISNIWPKNGQMAALFRPREYSTLFDQLQETGGRFAQQESVHQILKQFALNYFGCLTLQQILNNVQVEGIYH